MSSLKGGHSDRFGDPARIAAEAVRIALEDAPAPAMIAAAAAAAPVAAIATDALESKRSFNRMDNESDDSNSVTASSHATYWQYRQQINSNARRYTVCVAPEVANLLRVYDDTPVIDRRRPRGAPLTATRDTAVLPIYGGDGITVIDTVDYKFTRHAAADLVHFGGAVVKGRSHLRIATVNAEKKCGGLRGRTHLTDMLTRYDVDVLIVTEPHANLHGVEIGGAVDNEWIIHSPSPIDYSGKETHYVAIAVRRHLVHRMQELSAQYVHHTGRATAIALRGVGAAAYDGDAEAITLIIGVYLPTGAEVKPSAQTESGAIHADIAAWYNERPKFSTVIIAGDFNETIDPRKDRAHVLVTRSDGDGDGSGVAMRRTRSATRNLFGDTRTRVGALIANDGFIDCIATRHHGAFVPTYGWWMEGKEQRTESCIDHIIYRDNTARAAIATEVCAAATIAPSPFGEWPATRHLPVIALLAIAIVGDAVEGHDIATDSGTRSSAHPHYAIQHASHAQRYAAAAALERLLRDRHYASVIDPRDGERRGIAVTLSRTLKWLSKGHGAASCHSLIDDVTMAIVTAARDACADTLPCIATQAGPRSRMPKVVQNLTRACARLGAAHAAATADRQRGTVHDDTFALMEAAHDYAMGLDILDTVYDGIGIPPIPPPTASVNPALHKRWTKSALSSMLNAKRDITRAILLRRNDSMRRVQSLPSYDSHAPASCQPRTDSDLKRIVKGKRDPPVLSVVIDGKVYTDVHVTAEAHRAHYAKAFEARPPFAASADSNAKQRALRARVRALYDKRRRGIDSSWYGSLLAAVTPAELRDITGDTKWNSAAGDDGISAGPWRMFAHYSDSACTALCEWATLCITAGYRPQHGRVIVFQPIAKGRVRKVHRTVAETRPIALQNTLTKIPSKVLARRLSLIFARYPILHEEQRAFLKGGGSHQCTTALIDACERAKSVGKSIFCAFYDYKGAFDTIRHENIPRALARLAMPQTYIDWVTSALSDLRGVVRIGSAVSQDFAYERGTPQGSPESPLHYVVAVDPLITMLHSTVSAVHDGTRHGSDGRVSRIHDSPSRISDLSGSDRDEFFDGVARDGQCLRTAAISYADDLSVPTESVAALVVAHDTVLAFSDETGMTLSSKTFIGGAQPNDNGVQCTAMNDDGFVLELKELCVDGTPIQAGDSDAIQLLGATISMISGGRNDAAIAAVKSKMYGIIGNLTRAQLRVAAVSHASNRYLVPAIAHRLNTTVLSTADLKELDRILIDTMRDRANAGCRVGVRPCADAMATMMGTVLPSCAYAMTLVVEAFIRCNGPSDSADTIAARAEMTYTLDSANSRGDIEERHPYTRMLRACDVMRELLWHPVIVSASDRAIHTAHGRGSENDDTLLWQQPPLPANGKRRHIVYTDGSASGDNRDCECGWALVFDCKWMRDRFYEPKGLATVADEKEFAEKLRTYGIHNTGVIGECMPAASAHGAYGAELRAIWEALRRTPVDCAITIRTDCYSAILAITHYRMKERFDRQVLRCGGRPYLRLIDDEITRRIGAVAAAGNGDSDRMTVHFEHVRAHTRDTTMQAFGNRLVDCVAKCMRTKGTMSAGPRRSPFNPAIGEQWLCIEEPIDYVTATRPSPAAVANELKCAAIRRPLTRSRSQAAITAAVSGNDSKRSDSALSAARHADMNDIPDWIEDHGSLLNPTHSHSADGIVEPQPPSMDYGGERRAIIGDIRRAVVRRLTIVTRERWADKTIHKEQSLYAGSARGATDLWQFIAGDGSPADADCDGYAAMPCMHEDGTITVAAGISISMSVCKDDVEGARPQVPSTVTSRTPHMHVNSGTQGLFLRLLTNSLQWLIHQRKFRLAGSVAQMWTCTHIDCITAATATRDRQDRDLRHGHVIFTTAHLWICRAPPVIAVRHAAWRSVTALYKQHCSTAPQLRSAILAGRNSDGTPIVDDSGNTFLAWLTAAGLGNDSDHSVTAAAMGAFSMRTAMAMLRGEQWRYQRTATATVAVKYDKNTDPRAAVIAQLRSICVHATHSAWTASCDARVLCSATAITAAAHDTTNAHDGSHRDYPGRREPDDTDSGSDGNDDEEFAYVDPAGNKFIVSHSSIAPSSDGHARSAACSAVVTMNNALPLLVLAVATTAAVYITALAIYISICIAAAFTRRRSDGYNATASAPMTSYDNAIMMRDHPRPQRCAVRHVAADYCAIAVLRLLYHHCVRPAAAFSTD